MSKSQKNKFKGSQKSDSVKESRPKNQGPAGFPMFEYLGSGKDHSAEWLKFKKDLKGVIVQQKLDNLLEQIIDEGIDLYSRKHCRTFILEHI